MDRKQTHSRRRGNRLYCWPRSPLSACIASSRRCPPSAAEMETVDVVVAQHPLKLGTRLTKDHVKLVQWPANAPVAGTFEKVEDVVDRGVIATVEQNEPLTNAKLAALEAGAGLPPSIPPGMRAISVKVNEVVGVAGFVVPGTRVDVMVTLSQNRNDDDSLTRIVVSNAQVLTAGTRYDQEKAKEGTPIPSTVVTLLVTPEDGERIALAAVGGSDHAGAAESAGHDADHDVWCPHSGSVRPGGASRQGQTRAPRAGKTGSTGRG